MAIELKYRAYHIQFSVNASVNVYSIRFVTRRNYIYVKREIN